MVEPRRQEAAHEPTHARLLIVEARFYDDIADALMEGARRALAAVGATGIVITVPGALEIAPGIAMAVEAAEAANRPFDGVVALGCVVRGETTHYELVSGESARALTELSVSQRLPLGNGILTVENMEQAWARAKADELDKGGGAVEAALTLIRLKRRLAALIREH